MEKTLAITFSLVAVFAFSNGAAIAAPAFSFEELIERSDTIFIGSISEVVRKGKTLSVSFEIEELLRGNKESIPISLSITEGGEPNLVSDWKSAKYLAISQGDLCSNPSLNNFLAEHLQITYTYP